MTDKSRSICTLGCSKKTQLFPWKIPWPRAKESLSDVGLENIFVFEFCSSPDSAIVKNLSADFWKFYYTTILWIYIIFHILTQPKIHEKKYYNFQRHSLYFMRSTLRKFQRHSFLHMQHQRNIWNWVSGFGGSNGWRNKK